MSTNTRRASQTARTDKTASKLLAAWYGQLIGDAYGSTYEFSSPLRGITEEPVALKGGGGFGWLPGDVTDDSQMAGFGARMYVTAGRYNRGVYMAGLTSWIESRPRDVGAWTRGAMHSWMDSDKIPAVCADIPLDSTTKAGHAKAMKHPVYARWFTAGAKDAGNGGPMKCVPTLLATPNRAERIRETRLMCMDTHPDPKCWLSCIFMIEMATELAMDKSPKKAFHTALSIMMKEAGKANVDFDRYTRVLVDALTSGVSLEWNRWSNGGYVIPTMQVAVAAVMQAESFEHGLRMVISRGGDSDTVGAIAGVLLGARFGLSGMHGDGVRTELVNQIRERIYVDLGAQMLKVRQARS